MAKRKSARISSPQKAARARKGEKTSVLQEIDLCGKGFASPEELRQYLSEQTQETTTTINHWSVKTDSFPRGCMQVLLDYADQQAQETRIVQFHTSYGKIQKYSLQNPDLKLLLKTHGKWLTHLLMAPQVDKEDENKVIPPPKLQGCGYRWTTLHASNLQVLEIAMKYDVKRQLLDLTRRTPLRVDALKELILRDVGSNTTRPQLAALVTKAKQLRRLVLYEPTLEADESDEMDLAAFLHKIAQEADNKKLKVQVLNG